MHDDWEWIVSRAWSTRFVALAFLLSGAEVALPLLADKAPIDPVLFAAVLGLVTGAAFVARMVAQSHEPAVVTEAKADAVDRVAKDAASTPAPVILPQFQVRTMPLSDTIAPPGGAA